MHQFHLGPLGRLRALPSPSLGGGPDATATRWGAVHRSLGGRVTIDRLAVKRVWALTWPYLDPDTHAFLDALHLGAVAGPLWLVDPQRRNLASVRVATTGSSDRTTRGFTATAGTLAWTATVPDIGVPVAGGLSWDAPTGGSLRADTAVPVVPGEVITATAFVAATTPVVLTIESYDRTGAALPTTTSPSTVPGTAGTRVVLTATPHPSAATARMVLTAAAGVIATAGWQIEASESPTAWTPGGGASEVAVEAFTSAYPIPGAHASTLTLLEI